MRRRLSLVVFIGLFVLVTSGGLALPAHAQDRATSVRMTIIESVAPACVLRQSSVVAERTLVLQGSGFPLSQHSLQFRNVRNQATSILFDGEVNWQSATTVSVDMALIKHLLWDDPLLQLDVRLIDTSNWPNWVPLSDWSPDFLLADDQATCAAGFPSTPNLPNTTNVNVYLFVFDPTVNGQSAITYGGWNQPVPMTTNYITDVLAASGNTVRHTIVSHANLDAWTPKVGGYTFNQTDYKACLQSGGQGTNCSTMTDYAATLTSTFGGTVTSACAMLEQGVVDEIWWWGGPWFGFLEYRIVSPTTLCPNVDRLFTVMGFNYERTEAEMLHNLGHRAEQTVNEGIGYDLWDRFDGQRHRYGAGSLPDVDPANAHCGNVHFAPNGIQHYVRNRDFLVQSDCNDWQNYPNLTGIKQTVNYPDWFGGDARNEMKWWLSRLPHNSGVSMPFGVPYGVQHNWWKYIVPWQAQHTTFLPLLAH